MSKKVYFPRKKAPKQVVLIRWLDAYTIDDTYQDEDAKKDAAAPTVTVGFLVGKNKEGVTITTDVQLPLPGDKDEKLTYRGRHFIPWGMIYDVSVIR